ncbi:MAG: NUDIX domain-containing protein [Pseudomonadota bacterium]
MIRFKSPRIAARGVVVHDNRLLLVNAYPNGESDLWCAPGGGQEPGTPLPETAAREIHEETGLRVTVGSLCLVNEFHNPANGFHQVEVFFHCTVADPDFDPAWKDPENIVTERGWFTAEEMGKIRFKPDRLYDLAFTEFAPQYDPLEEIVR